MTDKAKLEKIEKLADAMYYAAMYLTTDASRLHKAMYEYHQFIIHECKEEPVSGNIDFEQELYKAFGQVKDFTLGMQIAKRFYDMGRNSKKLISGELEEAAEDYCKSTLVGSHSIKKNAFKAGAQWQKEQMMKDSVNAIIDHPFPKFEYPNLFPDYRELKDFAKRHKLKDEDKVKVIIIKENKDE